MSTKILKELKNLSQNELLTRAREVEAKYFQAKLKKFTGQLEDTASLWRMRKELARIKTLSSKKEQAEGSVRK